MTLAVLLLIQFALLICYISIWFVLGRRLNRLDVADTAWGGGFILVATVALTSNPTFRSWLVFALVLVWGLRLARHIWHRNALKGPDPRYDTLSAKWPKQNFWLRAYFSVFITKQRCY